MGFGHGAAGAGLVGARTGQHLLGWKQRRQSKGKSLWLYRLRGKDAAAGLQHLGQERQQVYAPVVEGSSRAYGDRDLSGNSLATLMKRFCIIRDLLEGEGIELGLEFCFSISFGDAALYLAELNLWHVDNWNNKNNTNSFLFARGRAQGAPEHSDTSDQAFVCLLTPRRDGELDGRELPRPLAHQQACKC